MTRSLLSALTLALSPAALASPTDLKDATLCLSPMLTVLVSVESGAQVPTSKLETQVYAELKKGLRAGGVRLREDALCKNASADLTVSLRVRPIRGSAALETQVSTFVQDETKSGATSWLGGELRWSTVEYGRVDATEAAVVAEVLRDTRTSLDRLVADWKTANP